MKASPLPDIGLRYIESLEDPVFEEFCRELAADGLNLRVESAPDPGPFMALEWLIPTAVFVYLGKSYFDGFLKEAGKDHYLILKKSLSKLSSKFFGKDAPQGRIISTPGKSLSEIPKYSIIYSVVAEVDKDLRVKLLLQADMNLIQCNEAQESFLDFLASIHDGSLNVATVKGLADAKPIGDTLLLEYDLTAKALVVVDPLAEHRRPGHNNSFKPTPHRGVNSVLYATLHAVAAPLRVGLTQALGPTMRAQEIPCRCPCCGYKTLPDRETLYVCEVCYWEDVGQDDHDADDVKGGPNGDLSLTQARANYREFGASRREDLEYVRPPQPDEM